MSVNSTIAVSLKRVHAVVKRRGGIHVVQSREILREDRELLLRTGWLEPIIRGWYLLVRPDVQPGDSSAWYASFWDFLHVYLGHHYGKGYCLSAEMSISLHLGNLTIPKQVVVMALKGSGRVISLPFDTSLFVYADPTHMPKARVIVRGLQVMSPEHALCRITPSYFQSKAQEIQIALQSLVNPQELLKELVDHRLKSAAERVVGAYHFLGNSARAEELHQALTHSGMLIRATNPFAEETAYVKEEYRSPYAARIHAMWERFRPLVLANFPKAPGLPRQTKAYLKQMNALYIKDAYHSLSIEGYQVTEELIEKVQKENWNPDGNPQDKQERDALSARGYYEAFLSVRDSIEKILHAENPGVIIKRDLPLWYQKLFAPCVRAQILPATSLVGYRRHQVYIRGSRHTPLSREHLLDSMDALFQRLREEDHAAVRAVLGHFLFVYIHPYMDGNGRISRFLMNAMLASGGYPWTIVRVENRSTYFAALEAASVEGDIVPFTRFLASQLKAAHHL